MTEQELWEIEDLLRADIVMYAPWQAQSEALARLDAIAAEVRRLAVEGDRLRALVEAAFVEGARPVEVILGVYRQVLPAMWDRFAARKAMDG